MFATVLAVIIAADAWGISKEKIQEALHTFKSVKRRVEVRGEIRGVTVIDDFAHHPTAVEETLKALRMKYDGRRLIAVFEPRSWSSRLAISRSRMERLSRTPTTSSSPACTTLRRRASSESPRHGRARQRYRVQGKPAMSFPDADAIVEHLAPELKTGDVGRDNVQRADSAGIHDKVLDVPEKQPVTEVFRASINSCLNPQKQFILPVFLLSLSVSKDASVLLA
jgi:UDP-N-acetylmuramate: L-alanyl-gamma-D-glutamyl-meso-diaminopimelate ligase